MNIATMLRAMSSLFWVVVLALIVLAVIRASRGQKVRALTTWILVLVTLAILLTVVSAGLVFVQPEQRAVVISALADQGYRPQALDPGLHWIVPFFENVVFYPISKQTYTMSMIANEGQVMGDDSVSARTSDGQEVFVDASVIFAINPTEVTDVHIKWQNRYPQDLVRPLARGAIRDAISQFRVEQVYSTERGQMTEQITQALRLKMVENGLLLDDFVLRNITFSPEYAASVEQKQIAEQQAQQAKFVVEQRIQEAQQAIETAKGQAESVRIRAQGDADARLIQAGAESEALSMLGKAIAENPDLLNYTYIQKLAPGIEVMLVPNTAPYILPLPNLPGSSGSSSATEPTP